VVVRDDVSDPVPASGQALVQVEACGICGSDLHFVKYGSDMSALFSEMEGLPSLGSGPPDLAKDVFMGHEFSATVLDYGPDTQGPKPGTVVTSMPVMVDMNGVRDLAYSNQLPGGYSDRMLLSAALVLEVPNGLDPRHAALTEPMAVGLHAVNRSGIKPGDGALVLGCGPIGLAVIGALKMGGIEPIVAADFSVARRGLAAAMGAHVVVDPSGPQSAFDAWRDAAALKPLVVFEAIGVPGSIDDIMRRAPHGARVVVVGVCMPPDSIHPFFGIAKEINMQFVLAYDPVEFANTLQAIAEGQLDVAPLITGEVGLAQVPEAFDSLANPERHCKILVRPAEV
jgi:threonine dehydrogenase-like Zn-dependent dehydrogenase